MNENKYIIKIGKTIIVHDARIACQSNISPNSSLYIPTSSVDFLSEFKKTNAYKNSFQAWIKVKIAAAANPGFDKGIMIVVKTLNLLAPSM